MLALGLILYCLDSLPRWWQIRIIIIIKLCIAKRIKVVLYPRLLWILSHTGTRSDSLRPTIQLLICINLTYPSVIIIACNTQVRRSAANLPTWLRTKGWKVSAAAELKAVKQVKEGTDQNNETELKKVKNKSRVIVPSEQVV